MIDHNKKIIFIHINKCAGISIVRALSRRFGSHDDAVSYKKKFPNKFNYYFKFSVVRNPWDKMVSFYNYHDKVRRWDYDWEWSPDNSPSFGEFIKISSSFSKQTQKYIFRKTGSRCTHHKRMSNQLDWISDKDGNILVDYIIRFENLQKDFDIVCDKIGVGRKKLPHKNKSKHKHYTEYYDDKTREIVAEKYATDIEYFGYEFGE